MAVSLLHGGRSPFTLPPSLRLLDRHIPQLWHSRTVICPLPSRMQLWRQSRLARRLYMPMLAAAHQPSVSNGSVVARDVQNASLSMLCRWVVSILEADLNWGRIFLSSFRSLIRSAIVIGAFSIVWGGRVLVVAQMVFFGKSLSAFASMPSRIENRLFISAFNAAEEKRDVDSAQKNSGLIEHFQNGADTLESWVRTDVENLCTGCATDCVKSWEYSEPHYAISDKNFSELKRKHIQEIENPDIDSEENFEEKFDVEEEHYEIDRDASSGFDPEIKIQEAVAVSEVQTNRNDDGTQKFSDNQYLMDDHGLKSPFEVCRSKPYKLTVPLRIVGLRGSVPAVWLKDFMLSQGRRAKTVVEYRGNLKEIITVLATVLEKGNIKPQSIVAADLVTVGDSWLGIAVSGGLIEPIKNAEQYDWFQKLDPRWQALLRRNEKGHLDSQGDIWGVPYRWGSMVIAYKKDKLAKNNASPIKDWIDLWRPELAGKISMVDSPREVIGAVLKSLGASYNTLNFEKDVRGGKEAVKQQFLALQKQVRLFDSTQYLKALEIGDVWVAVGWSSDVIPLAKRMSNVTVVAPESGTSLWADIWAIPAAGKIQCDKIGGRIRGPSPLIYQWLEFCLQPARALPFQQGVFAGASPLCLLNSPRIMNNSLELTSINGNHRKAGPQLDSNFIEGMPPLDIMAKSEFLEPLSPKAVMDYQWLFSEGGIERVWPNNFWDFIRGIIQWPLGLALSLGLRH
eukprot:c28523_g1_i1 orf=126-2333(+)